MTGDHSLGLYSSDAFTMLRYWELPVAMVAGTVVAVLAWGAAQLALGGRGGRGLRASVSAGAVLLALALLSWGHFAWLGTLDGAASDNLRCDASNVPAWWPSWIPA
ncbi:hypothetical protein [Allostreptomyces psammosilenae]|uniref:Uncharacterized protein n=1 Tax=Allostreptomyces psammosilenae TaxID=1892865 RepID=A0A852ZWT3_9ACTN|nr:hypothetical protein [Allostreptomyces psammosilenae]NYI05710.1 hypothetical protein [Allostreptomyces psammosilenae]